MVRAILGDANFEGHTRVLTAILGEAEWREFWDPLGLQVLTFARLGLPGATPDDELWRLCQREQIVLLTANRNHDGPTSLEAVIRVENRPDSLPVITVADDQRLIRDREYAVRVAVKLLDYLTEIDRYRGTGRLYAP